MTTWAPTGFALPSLVYDRKTRVSGEHYLYYNLGIANYLGTVGIDGSSNVAANPATSCGTAGVNPASGFMVARMRRSMLSLTDIAWTVGGLSGTIPGASPVGQACELGAPLTSLPSTTTVSAVTGSPGDSIDVIVLPPPAGDVLICYDQGLNVDTGQENKAIARKFSAVDHFVRQRPDNKVSLKDLLCCNLQGLSKLRQRDFTLKSVFYPDGGAIPSEIRYYTNCRLSVPTDIPEDSNESVMISAEGIFKDAIVFTAVPN